MTSNTEPRFMCPVCGYDGLHEPLRNERNTPSGEICPSCGFEFGFDDDSEGKTYEGWRGEWIAGGMRWWSSSRRPPRDWNPAQQLAALLR